MYRTASGDAGPSSGSSKIWRLPISLRKKTSKIGRDERSRNNLAPGGSVDYDPFDAQSGHRSIDSASTYEVQENSYRQLQSLVQRMRSAPSSPGHVDAAYKEFEKLREPCSTLCYGILQEEMRPPRTLSNATETLARRDSSVDAPSSPGGAFDQRSSFSGRSLTEVITGGGGGGGSRPPQTNEAWLSAIREWRSCLETLCEAFRVSLSETYKSYQRDASQEMVDLLFTSKKFRREAVHRMRNANVTRVLSADPQFFPRYEIRFRNYERVRKELNEIRQLLQSGESGISPSREVKEFPISLRGDAMLEFANIGPDASPGDPVIRVRVSSHMLAETSPIFARMFSGHDESLLLHEAEDITPQLPPPPTPYVCRDGTEVRLYRMPQYEVNREQSLEVLMHAAHMHNELVPREVTFEQFVAIAECSIRYRSTSPLELVVEHRWLPQWMHRGADDMPDGLLVISYAFGSRQLFTRMSKSAILHLVDERDLRSKPWPPKIQDKIWAVRCAKLDQVYSCCIGAIQEYLRPPPPPSPPREGGRDDETDAASAPAGLTSTPRCPKGSHSCDAGNLGWMMLILHEMGLSPHILQEAALSHMPPSQQPPSRSIAQMVELLRSMPSPPSPIHRGGVCDPGPAFRTAVADIYNSVTGLTLHDVSGKSHGWALSKHRMAEPQTLPTTGLDRMAAPVEDYTVVNEFPDRVRLRIMGEIDDLEDLYSAAQISRSFYETYKAHEVGLMRSMIRADRLTRGSIALPPQRGGNAEDKVLKEEADRIQVEGAIEGVDAVTVASDYESSDDGDADDDDDDDELVLESAPPPRSVATAASLWKQPPRYDGPPSTVTVHVEPMTDEEARRILWPDDAETPTPTPIAAAPRDGLREKVLVGDPAFAGRLEEKTLVTERPSSEGSRSDRSR